MSLAPNDKFRCHSRTCTIWFVFLLLQQLAENALRRILVAMAELSFGEPTRSSRCTRDEFSSVYFCALSSPTKFIKVGLWRHKVQVHTHSWAGADNCRRQQVNCASLLLSSNAFVSPLSSWEPYLAIFLQVCWFRYPNGSKQQPTILHEYILTDTNLQRHNFGMEEASKHSKTH